MDNDVIEKRKMLFSQRLKKALEELNVTQTELCQRTDIPKSAMSQYVSGSFQPKQDRLYKIADSLNISPAWLMGYDVPMRVSNKGGFKIHPNLNGGSLYLAWQEKDLIDDYVKREQAKENIQVIPCFNMDDVDRTASDVLFSKPLIYRPLIEEIKTDNSLIYVINNTKYPDYKDFMYPLIGENDLILLDFGAEAHNGDFVMIELVPGRNFFCHYYKYDDFMEFQFESHKPIRIQSDDKDYERYEVRGKVKQIIKNIT